MACNDGSPTYTPDPFSEDEYYVATSYQEEIEIDDIGLKPVGQDESYNQFTADLTNWKEVFEIQRREYNEHYPEDATQEEFPEGAQRVDEGYEATYHESSLEQGETLELKSKHTEPSASIPKIPNTPKFRATTAVSPAMSAEYTRQKAKELQDHIAALVSAQKGLEMQRQEFLAIADANL